MFTWSSTKEGGTPKGERGKNVMWREDYPVAAAMPKAVVRATRLSLDAGDQAAILRRVFSEGRSPMFTW